MHRIAAVVTLATMTLLLVSGSPKVLPAAFLGDLLKKAQASLEKSSAATVVAAPTASPTTKLSSASSGQTPTPERSDALPGGPQRLAELQQMLQKDPRNIEALLEIGESYFLANRFQEAIQWQEKLLAIDPKNARVQTELGASYFNLGRIEDAKAAWLAGLAVAPNDVQLHYNMGFLYANTEPRDPASARKEWQRVLELAPDSGLAKTVKEHMNALGGP